MEGNLQRSYTNEDLNMQIDYYNFMFNIRTYESEGKISQYYANNYANNYQYILCLFHLNSI